MFQTLKLFGAAAAVCTLGACADISLITPEPPSELRESVVAKTLIDLPPPTAPIPIAVYEFPDLTGQNKANDNFADFSRAVTQGGADILVDVLDEVGGGSWFTVIERRGVTNILRERQLVTATRQQFDGPDAEPLPPMLFAGVIFEGGIITYDSNIQTGGAGARYLGIGASQQYRVDEVTVSLRAVGVQSGEVLASVTTSKSIYSVAVRGDVFRYVAVDEILELEAGVTENEPTQFAVRETIELAVYALIVEGAERGVWSFRDRQAQQRVLASYTQRGTNLVESDAPPPT